MPILYDIAFFGIFFVLVIHLCIIHFLYILRVRGRVILTTMYIISWIVPMIVGIEHEYWVNVAFAIFRLFLACCYLIYIKMPKSSLSY